VRLVVGAKIAGVVSARVDAVCTNGSAWRR
jgi:hypothetical protein